MIMVHSCANIHFSFRARATEIDTAEIENGEASIPENFFFSFLDNPPPLIPIILVLVLEF